MLGSILSQLLLLLADRRPLPPRRGGKTTTGVRAAASTLHAQPDGANRITEPIRQRLLSTSSTQATPSPIRGTIIALPPSQRKTLSPPPTHH